jgi:hypothetical protein
MEHRPTADSRNLTRPFAILGACLVLAGSIMALGFWLAFDRAMDRFERSVSNHAAAVRDSGHVIGPPVAQAVAAAGERIARPEIRVVDPMPIQEPVKIRGIKDDGTLPIEAKIAK